MIGCSHFLVPLRSPQIPRLDDVALCLVDVFLVLHVLDADADAVLCEDDVLAAHALGRGLAHLCEGEVDLVEDPAAAAEEGDGDDEGDDLAGAERKMHHVSSGCLFCYG